MEEAKNTVDKHTKKNIYKQEKRQTNKQSKSWKRVKIILILILMVLLIVAGIFTYKMSKNGWGLQGFIATAMGHDENTLKNLDKMNFLVVGISGYEEDYKLADTIMVCSYDPKIQQASMLSIPRDTYIGKDKTKAKASYKINAVYRNGKNIEGMRKSIEELTGLTIPNYVIIDTDALIELVDAIGGVEFEVPIAMKYDDATQNLHIDLKAGKQKLTGQQAEWLVRFRHNNDGTSYSEEYGDNDIGRMRTQREFITAVMQQTLKSENILKLNKLAEIAYKNIQTNVTFDTIKDYIPYSVNFSTEKLKTGVLPGTPEYANKVAIYSIDKKKAKQVIDELFKNYTENNEISNTTEVNTIADE